MRNRRSDDSNQLCRSLDAAEAIHIQHFSKRKLAGRGSLSGGGITQKTAARGSDDAGDLSDLSHSCDDYRLRPGFREQCEQAAIVRPGIHQRRDFRDVSGACANAIENGFDIRRGSAEVVERGDDLHVGKRSREAIIDAPFSTA